VTGSDRIGQFDLTRCYVLGPLSQVQGYSVLLVDERPRILYVRAVTECEYAAPRRTPRAGLAAFAECINVAAQPEPRRFSISRTSPSYDPYLESSPSLRRYLHERAAA
jgi:acyl-homoserine lactone acylase PvdQ